MNRIWIAGAMGLMVMGTVAARATRSGPRDPRAAIFLRRGCSECHAISALQVRASKDVGPDLTYAYGDVVNRYGVDLEAFLDHPSGVMRMMLAAHLHLSAVDRDSILQILKGLYLERRADAVHRPFTLPSRVLHPRSGT
jgi:mono/diheme cytochrome c family protein